MMAKKNLPEESTSQEIGHHAVIAFNSKHPISWRTTPTDGDADAGLDFQVQLIADEQFSGLFHAQIKGSRQLKNGKNKALNSDNTCFSVKLSIKTLNYYLKIESPVLLVFADLTTNEDVRQCDLYYKWIDDELNDLSEGNSNLDHLGKKTHTFTISIKNILDDKVDVLPYLLKRQQKKIAFQTLFTSIEPKSDEPIKIVTKLSKKLSTSEISLESIIQESDNPWIDAPKNSFAHLLKESHDSLNLNALSKTLITLKKLKKRLNEASPHERTEYLFQYGQYYSKLGDNLKAGRFYTAAHNKLPNNKKYHTAYLHNQFYFIIDKPETSANLLGSISDKTSIEYVNIKAKLLCLLGRHDEAFTLLSGFPEKKIIVIKCLVYQLKRDYQGLIEICNHGIETIDLNERQLFTLLSLRARGKFNIGAGIRFQEAFDDQFIPYSGFPDMDISLLKEAYEDVSEALRLGKILNYPRDIELFIDIASGLFFIFNDAEYLYSYLKTFHKIHPKCEFANNILLSTSQKLEKYETVAYLLKDLPKTPENIVNHILNEYVRKNKPKVVRITIENLQLIKNKQVKNADIALGIAAQCANELLMNDELDVFLKAIKEFDNANVILSTYELVTSINENILSREHAVNKYYESYKKYEFDNMALSQLYEALTPDSNESSKRIVEVSQDIKNFRNLEINEYYKLFSALATLKKWQEIIEKSNIISQRFGNPPRLVAYRALALDGIGNTPKAFSELAALIEKNLFDPYAFEIYTQICIRCGLIDKAVYYINEILSKTDDKKAKIYLLRQLFSIEFYIKPNSPKLYEICKKLGNIVDRNDETEEGIFLMQFLMSTLDESIQVDKSAIKEFQQRLKDYQKNFPNSSVLKSIPIRKDSGGQEILEQLEKAVGLTREKKRWYEKTKNQLKSGELPIPFAIRHHVLYSINNTQQLWHISKNSGYSNNHLHLAILTGSIDPQYSNDKFISKVPLFDCIALLVLADIDLLQYLLEIFPKIAISKWTISDLHAWRQDPILYNSQNSATKALSFLTDNIDSIFQPSGNRSEEEYNGIFGYLDYHKNIINTQNYLLYSDDAISRLYIYGNNYKKFSLCTIDYLEHLRHKSILNDEIVAEKYALLCSFNISNTPVKYRDILFALRSDIPSELPISKIVEMLGRNVSFNSFINFLWNPKKEYDAFLKEIGRFLSIILGNVDGIFVENNIVAAIWYFWLIKVQFLIKSETDRMSIISRSFISIAINLKMLDLANYSTNPFENLWSIYEL